MFSIGLAARWCVRPSMCCPFGPAIIPAPSPERSLATSLPLSGSPGGSRRIDLNTHRGRLGERLKDHAVPLGQLDQLLDLFGSFVGLDRERQSDLREANRSILCHS